MSMKHTIVTVAATLALAIGAGAAGTLSAKAATSACSQHCDNWFSAAYGTAEHPNYVLGLSSATSRSVTLTRASGANPAEDFAPGQLLTPVSDWVTAGLMPPGLDALYGKLGATEIEYAPKGIPTDQCLGVGAHAGVVAGLASVTRVTLLPCGESARTLWIVDPVTTPAGSYFALISGTTDRNFVHPEALTVLKPGLPLVTAPLVTHIRALPLNHQLWSFTQGALPIPKPSA